MSWLDDGVSMWVIYRQPLDFPRHFVVREQRALPGNRIAVAWFACLYDCLEDAMAECEAAGLTFLHPFTDDDPVIVGTWL